MDRNWIGYDPTIPVDELFAVNRGTWVMGPRANRERYAAFSYAGEIEVRRRDRIRVEPAKFGGRKIIVGQVLDPDHPITQRIVGSLAPDNSRNPVTYHDDPDANRVCPCGCGSQSPSGRAFLPGQAPPEGDPRTDRATVGRHPRLHPGRFDQTYAAIA